MRVLLKRNWFAPGGQRFRQSADKYDYRIVPDELSSFLPKDAVLVQDHAVELRPVEEQKALKDFDEARQSGEVVIAAKEKADAEQEEADKAARFKAQLAEERAAEEAARKKRTPSERRAVAKANASRERE